MKTRVLLSGFQFLQSISLERSAFENIFVYLSSVLRTKLGDEVVFFNGVDFIEHRYTVCSIDKKSIAFAKTETVDFSHLRKESHQVFLSFAIVKNNQLSDLIRCCTEAGVFGFVPLKTAYSMQNINIQRARAISAEAIEQSEGFILPSFETPRSLDKFFELVNSEDAVIFCNERLSFNNSSNLLSVARQIKESNFTKVYIIIGPEGGFSESEVEFILNSGKAGNEGKFSKNFFQISLGQKILKASTAALVTSFLFSL